MPLCNLIQLPKKSISLKWSMSYCNFPLQWRIQDFPGGANPGGADYYLVLKTAWKWKKPIELGALADPRGGRQGRTPPPRGPNSFIFMQFSAKNWKIIALLGVGAPPGENPGSATGGCILGAPPPTVTALLLILAIPGTDNTHIIRSSSF